ncbi:MAG: RnfH family protein [Fimbriimonadaceae bacterium]|nr:RnfH family protein [Alphaproteobacteria bacterium]
MTDTANMVIGVAYATLAKQLWLRIELPEGATVKDAIVESGILKEFIDIDLEIQKVGIFGRVVTLEDKLKNGDRVEIYRTITADPKEVRRKKVDKNVRP